MATGAGRRGEGLVMMRFLQVRAVGVAVETERRSSLGQMKIKLGFAHFSGLMCDMAGIAAHVEGGVAAAFFRNVQALFMAIKAEILALIPRRGLKQLILVVAGVRIVTLDAIAHGRRMHAAFEGGGVFVGMATEAKCLRSRSDELDASYIFVDPNFVAAQTSGGNGGVDGLALRFVIVALEAFFGVDVLLKRNRMLLGYYRCGRDR